MDLLAIAAILLGILALLLGAGVWIAVALMATGWAGMQFAGGNIPAGSVLVRATRIFRGRNEGAWLPRRDLSFRRAAPAASTPSRDREEAANPLPGPRPLPPADLSSRLLHT